MLPAKWARQNEVALADLDNESKWAVISELDNNSIFVVPRSSKDIAHVIAVASCTSCPQSWSTTLVQTKTTTQQRRRATTAMTMKQRDLW